MKFKNKMSWMFLTTSIGVLYVGNANAWSAEFTLTSAGTVSFMVPGSDTYDNTGGMSLHIVPEPSIIALIALGLAGIGFSNRKKVLMANNKIY